MTVVPLSSLTQFNSIVSSHLSLQPDATCILFLCLISPSCCTDQRGSRRRHLFLGVLVRSLSRHDADLQRRRGLGLARGRRLLQSGHRPRERHCPARRRTNGARLNLVPNPPASPTAHRPCIRDGCIVLTRSKRVPCA